MKTFFKKAIKPLFILTVAVSLVSCLDKSDRIKSDVQSSGSKVTKIESAKDLKGMKIGYCSPSLDAPYYQALFTSIKENTEINGMEFTTTLTQKIIRRQGVEAEKLDVAYNQILSILEQYAKFV